MIGQDAPGTLGPLQSKPGASDAGASWLQFEKVLQQRLMERKLLQAAVPARSSIPSFGIRSVLDTL